MSDASSIEARFAAYTVSHPKLLQEAHDLLRKEYSAMLNDKRMRMAVKMVDEMIKGKKKKKKDDVTKVMEMIMEAEDWTKRFNKLGYYSLALDLQVYVSPQTTLFTVYRPDHKDHFIKLEIEEGMPFASETQDIWKKIEKKGEANFKAQVAAQLLPKSDSQVLEKRG